MGIFKIITKPIGCIISLLTLAAVGFVGLVVLVFLSFHYIMPAAVTGGIKTATGFPASIEEHDSSLLDARLGFKGFSISNPEGYPSPHFVSLHEISVDFNAEESQGNTFVFDSMVVDVAHVSYVENQDGVGNANAFVDALKKLQKESQEQAGTTQDSEPMQLLIKQFTIRVGKVTMQRNGSSEKVFNVDYDRTFENVTDPNTLASKIASDMKGLGVAVLGTVLVEGVTGTLGDVGGAALDIGEGALDVGGEAVKGVGDAVEGVGGAIRDLF